MDEIGKKLWWIIIILPGFLSVSLASYIVDPGEISEFQLTFYAVSLTLVNISVTMILWYVIVLILGLEASSNALLHVVFGGVVLVVSVVVGLSIGILAERGTLFSVLRSIPLADSLNKRSSVRPLTFLLRQNTTGQLQIEGDGRPTGKVSEAWLRVDVGDESFEGWPEFYDSSPTEIYLSPACRVVDLLSGKEALKISGPGVIVPEREISTFIFLDRGSSPCYRAWYP